MGRGQRDMSGSVGTATSAARAQTAGGGTGDGDARVGDTGGAPGGREGAYHLLHIIFLKSEKEKSN